MPLETKRFGCETWVKDEIGIAIIWANDWNWICEEPVGWRIFACQNSTVSVLLSLHEAAYFKIDLNAIRIRKRGDQEDLPDQVFTTNNQRFLRLETVFANLDIFLGESSRYTGVYARAHTPCSDNGGFADKLNSYINVHDKHVSWSLLMLNRNFGSFASSQVMHLLDFMLPIDTSESKWVFMGKAMIGEYKGHINCWRMGISTSGFECLENMNVCRDGVYDQGWYMEPTS